MHKFREINSNFCRDSCPSGNEYHIEVEGETICYPSCKDIPPGPNGKYLYEIEKTSPGSGGTSEKICSDINVFSDVVHYT